MHTRMLKWFKRSLLIAGLTASAAFADESPEKKGFEIAARSDRSDRGFVNSEVELKMVLRNRAGRETERSLSLKTLEVPDEQLGDKSVIVFDSPADIEGTALLSHAKILDPDDQWLYLPALKRTKRISSVNKSGPFVGSEFAFEDFTSLELNKYDYKFLRTETLNGLTCDVVERYPKYKYSGYKKQISWIDQTDFQVRQVEFYDRRGDLLKVLTLEDYRKYKDKFWRPHKMLMVNRKTGKSTDFIYSEYDFDRSLSEREFVKSALNRLR
ncbi:MAG: outer membrane lipoprotein-sorting protein [Verrucomicrobiota bacterium]